jgi:hypothetical protein
MTLSAARYRPGVSCSLCFTQYCRLEGLPFEVIENLHTVTLQCSVNEILTRKNRALTVSACSLQEPALDRRLTSFSPIFEYPSLYQHGFIARTVNNGVHSIDRRLLQPAPGFLALILVALDDYLVVADENRRGLCTLIPVLPEQGQR